MSDGHVANQRKLLWITPNRRDFWMDQATWLEVAPELARLGWQVTLVVWSGQGLRAPPGVDLVEVPQGKVAGVNVALYHAALLSRFARSLRRFDIVLFHEVSAPFLAVARWGLKVGGGPRPTFVLDSRSLPLTGVLRTNVRGGVVRLVHRFAAHLSDGQTVITRRLADELRSRPDRLLGIWSSGVRVEPFRDAARMRTWPGQVDPLRLVYIGSLAGGRGLLKFCEAVRLVNAERSRVTLTLFGRGLATSQIEQLTRSWRPGEIELSAPLRYERMPGVLAAAHLGVLPFGDSPVWRTSSPLKLFEYLAAGLPIVATRIAAHLDVLHEADCTFWADDADPPGLAAAIVQAIARRQELPAMGDRAAALAEQWTWRRSAENLGRALETARARHLSAHPTTTARQGSEPGSDQYKSPPEGT